MPFAITTNRSIARTIAVSVSIACATTVGAAAATRRSKRVATTTYAIKSVGAPPTSYSSFTYPTGFNNTDQLVGGAYLVSGSPYEQCLAYTGKNWVNVLGAPSLTCYPTSDISDANASGIFKTVGGTFVPTNSQQVAFYATVESASSSAVISSSNALSEL